MGNPGQEEMPWECEVCGMNWSEYFARCRQCNSVYSIYAKDATEIFELWDYKRTSHSGKVLGPISIDEILDFHKNVPVKEAA